jgi:hypothetical protein
MLLLLQVKKMFDFKYCFATISNEIAGESRLLVLHMCFWKASTYSKQNTQYESKKIQIHLRYDG